MIDCLHSKKPQRQPSGKPLIQLNNIIDDGILNMTDTFYISEDDYAKWISRCEVKPGDCVITNVGRIGAVSQVPQGTTAAMGRNMTCIRPGAYAATVITALCSNAMRYEIEKRTDAGTIMNALNVRNIPKLELYLPPAEVRDSVETTLKTIQDARELLLKERQEFAALRDGYLEELFDSYFRQSLNMVDETWDTASLLDIADYKNGLAMQKFRPNIGDKGLPVLKIRELGQESCGKDAERCRSDIDESVTVHDGDLVFSWSGTLLLRFWAGGDAGLNQHLFKVTSGIYPSWFYYAWTKHHLARFTMLAKDRATTMGHIKRSALEESEVLLPPKEKLAMQTKCMQPIIDQVIANKIEIRKLAALRDTLLPKLMSGEIDVSKIDLTQLNSHLA